MQSTVTVLNVSLYGQLDGLNSWLRELIREAWLCLRVCGFTLTTSLFGSDLQWLSEVFLLQINVLQWGVEFMDEGVPPPG